ncbi:PAQR family membrane homeostasis protein TrhA [Virgibacillus litoralis]|uniref:Hemolysin III n=1 Tax=Virgibacillus litoralis TaxID=578221 RepID=A0ABS4HCT2_9BACI|nr:hemolysin III family protein [Virgibacillus litoralis]MBP1948727.1 hemolysin III [Virgibacillus litoralis]
MEIHTFTKKEEIVHAITHGIGALLSIAGLVLLIIFASLNGSPWQIVSVTIFGTTMLIMYLSSTIVHSLPEGKWKDIFQIFDHSSIYLFIAGTYTPFLLVYLRDELGWILFGTVWGIALIGVVFKIFFVKKFLVLSTLFYVLMGWLITLVWNPLTAIMDGTGMLLLMIGGMFYTLGAIFYIWRGFIYHHAVWHLFVLAGSIFHFFTVFYYVI